jgi:DNA-binding LacI/PurR family transcriptional regulator
MSPAIEKATAFLSKLEADRMAAIAVSEEKVREAMLIKARQEGFREAMEIFGLSITPDAEVETSKFVKGKRRDIRQMIIKELSFSGTAMSREQIAKAIDYLSEGTEAALKRLESAGKIVQNRDGHWEAVAITVAQPNGHAH